MWSALSGKNLHMVEGIQRHATKFILGYHNPYQSYKDRLLALKLLSVCYWHEIKDLVFFFKIINGFYNVDISNLIQPKILLKSTRNSCSLDYVVPKCKTSQFQKSYFVRTVKLRNNLPTSTRCLSSVACFRSALYHHYKSALDSTFDCDNISTWKSVCSKCLFTRDLTSSSYRQCC